VLPYKPYKICVLFPSAELSRTDLPHSREMWKILRDIFHIKSLRTNQLQVINAAMMKKNCFVLMPTGGGKSLCYQVTALLGDGVTFVVSPLKSLIQDQVQRLTSMRVGVSNLCASFGKCPLSCSSVFENRDECYEQGFLMLL